MLAAGLLHLRRLPGVMRPAIAVPIPARDGASVLLDAGANADARAEHLLQFAPHGRRSSPRRSSASRARRCGCSRSARRTRRATRLTLDAHALLRGERARTSPATLESRDLLRGAADVVVTDGFTGNVALKLLEGTIRELLDALRDGDHRDDDRQARRPADPAGRAAPAHPPRPGHLRRRVPARPARAGGDRPRQLERRTAIANAIRLAARGVDHRVVERLAERLPRARPCMIARFSGSRFSPPNDN